MADLTTEEKPSRYPIFTHRQGVVGPAIVAYKRAVQRLVGPLLDSIMPQERARVSRGLRDELMPELTALRERVECLEGRGSVGGFGLPANLPGMAVSTTQLDLPQRALKSTDSAMSAYLAANPDDAYALQATQIDRVRYARSLQWLEPVLRPGEQVLELGGKGLSTAALQTHFPEVTFVHVDFDLRQPFPFADQHFDHVLCMEVIEHVCDIAYEHATTLSGVKQCLAEAHRVLKPQGALFLTTPNAASLFTMHKAMQHQAPMLYEGHFREFTLGEMRALVSEAAFHVERAETVQVWHFFEAAPRMMRFLASEGVSVNDRGDNTFIVARRAS